MTYPPAFWSWVRWKDKGSPGALPPDVRAYYLAHHITKAPLSWQARYLLHKGLHIPTPADLAPVRNLLVFATPTDDGIRQALTLNPRWRILFSADRVYQPTDAQLQMVRSANRRAWCWCDCRTTLPAAAKLMVQNRGMAGWYGQGENAAEFDVCVAAGGTLAIVNLSVLRPTATDPLPADQLPLVAEAKVLVTNENYRNVHPSEQPNWRNANNGIGGNCGAVYESAPEGAVYTSAASQIRNGWFGVHDSWYLEGFMPADWQALRDLG